MIGDFAARLLLSPVLLAQAVFVVARALRLPEAAGPRAGSIGSGPPLRLMILGDSSAAGVGVTHQDAALAGQLSAALAAQHTVHWQLIARTGATTDVARQMLREAAPAPADIVVTALGVNDITRGKRLSRWRASQRALRAEIRSLTGARRLYVSGVPPLGAFPLLPNPLRWTLGRNATRADAGLRADLAAEPDVVYMPFTAPLDASLMAEDGFHPGPEIYAEWARVLASRILSDWPRITQES